MYELLSLNCTLRNALSPRCDLGSGESTQETILRALNSTLSIKQACPASIETFVFYHLNTTEARDKCGTLMETQMQAASLLFNDEVRKIYDERFMPHMQFVDSVARLNALDSRCSWPSEK
jgi:hypothetical protein